MHLYQDKSLFMPSTTSLNRYIRYIVVDVINICHLLNKWYYISNTWPLLNFYCKINCWRKSFEISIANLSLLQINRFERILKNKGQNDLNFCSINIIHF